VSKYGLRNLRAELEDERARDWAITDDHALVAYQTKWAKRLARLQRAHANRWRLRGLSDPELRDELTLRLIDAVRTKPEARAAHNRPGQEWGLLFLAHERDVLRGGFRLNVVLADPARDLEHARCVSEEERIIEGQSAGILAIARERAERGLSRPQRRWLAAMRIAANAGAFFASSGQLNLSAASRLLGKNRSSAVRAFDELKQRFGRERRKLER
jgi:hypothetical protein